MTDLTGRDQFLKMIIEDNIQGLRVFTADALTEYGTPEKLDEANKIADVLCQMLKKKSLIDEATHQSFVDVMISAALLHNLFFDSRAYLNKETDQWEDLYKARRILKPLADEYHVNPQALDALFGTIEAQLGEDTPVVNSIAKPNTPTELFAYAVWIIKEYMPL